MSPITHLLISWSVANTTQLERRDRAIVTLSGIISDADGLGIVIDFIIHKPDIYVYYWKYHHELFHNLTFALIATGLAFFLSLRRWTAALLVFITIHLHFLCDLVGSRAPGAGGYQWEVPYLMPFTERWTWVWDGQWALNAWPNVLITFIFLISMFYIAWRRGCSPLEMISPKLDRIWIATLRQRFGIPDSNNALSN